MLLTFSKSLYLREAVDRAAGAYASHLAAQVEENGDDVVVRVKGDDPGEEIVDNFMNHVLFETVRLRQQAAETRS